MKSIRQWILIGTAFALMAGCARPPAEQPQNEQGEVRQQTVPDTRENRSRQDIAAHLEGIVKSIPQVEDARCVVLGNTAIVGINVEPGLDRARVDSIKYSAAEALKKDPYGVNSLVTADLDLNQRINEVREDINQGRPLSGMAEELGDIIGRIMPQIPRHINPVEPPPAAGHTPGTSQPATP